VPHAQLGEATAAFARKIAAQAPLAQRLAKEALRVGLNLNLPYFYDYQRHGQRLMLTSNDHLEGAKSFVEKRAANFKGE
jgi:enoyl-CoA hydratase/carnithine racemase